ncbi:hypothetical protein [Stenotrophomonas maltophilia]|uniref:hypothetical protein n=1 Tax=Stenotrophomonas maltophilia TaxID=40324 RepID=UPI0015C52CD1|nr:hypothetical protein [Stenotrophomonas maltophilia]
MISSKLLCAATLLCLSPFAASAAEAHLTPSTNGGSGAMPSGYSKLYFETSDSDFAAELKLPSNPRYADAVVLTSLSGYQTSRLDAAGTSVADLVYIPVRPFDNYVLYSNNKLGYWMVSGEGLSSDRIGLKVDGHAQAPATDKRMIDLNIGAPTTSVGLPGAAPNGAVLGLVNYAGYDLEVKGPELAGQPQTCAAAQICAFVFDAADGQWHARRGRAHFQPTTSQLPKMAQRWTDIVLSGPAEDVITPLQMTLPVEAIEGDVIQIRDMSDSRAYRVNGETVKSTPTTYRYSSSAGEWVSALR